MPYELHIAAADKKNGYLKVKQLIEEKPVEEQSAYVNCIHPDHLSKPVDWAAQSGSLKTLRYLIKVAHADLHASVHTHNLLFWALENSKKIIQYVARPNIIQQFQDGTTDLHAAIAIGNLNKVKKLAKHPGRINEKNSRDETSLFWAVKAENRKIASFIVHHPDFISLDAVEKWDPLHRYFGKKYYYEGKKYSSYNQACHAYKKAIDFLQKIKIIDDPDKELLSNCCIELSKIYLAKKSKINLILQAVQEALHYALEIKNSYHAKCCQAVAYHHLFWIYEQLDKMDEAIIAFEHALDWENENKKELLMHTHGLYNNIQNNNVSKTIHALQVEINSLQDLNPLLPEEKNDVYKRLACAYDNLASLYCQSGQQDIIHTQQQSIAFLEKITPKQDEEFSKMAKSYKRLGFYYIREKNSSEAIKVFEKSIEYCYQIKNAVEKDSLIRTHQFILEFYRNHYAISEHKLQLQEEAKAWGYECFDTQSDGDCFFHAIAHQMLRCGSHLSCDASSLRTMTANHIKQYFDFYRGFIDEKNPDDYLEKLSKSGTWVDPIGIQALARVFHVTLVIINSDRTIPIIIKQLHSHGTLYLGYEIDWHYQSLIPRPDWQATKFIQPLLDAAPIDDFVTLPLKRKREEDEKNNDLPPSKLYRSSQTFFENNLAPPNYPLEDNKPNDYHDMPYH